MASPPKRKLDVYKDLTSIEKETDSASVHGVVMTLSPLKSTMGRSFFDGTHQLRIVGFSSKQQEQLQNVRDKKEAVTHELCCQESQV